MKTQLLKYQMIYSVAILLSCSTAFAQSKPVNIKPVTPAGKIQPDAMMDIRERLVQLALQNPTYEVADRKVTIANFQVKKAKGGWLTPISLQGNLNEFAFKGNTTVINPVTGVATTTNPSTFYPKYNIGATVPLSLFSEKRNDIKIAKENLSIAQAEKNQHFREIKAQVLTKYEDYILFQQKLDFQSQVTQDARTAYLASEKDFQEGAIKQEDYNKSYRAYTDEKVRQAEFLRNYNVIKLELESMIGISMDDLLKK
ncbi:MAG TPA: TolC family protein [Chitinophagaceae bacterium]|jgi:outer membrane protein TolC|nr:TolC family protein [Chitinophagaceae bacterium]